MGKTRKETLRRRRGPKKRVLPQGLEREPAEESGDATAIKTQVVFGAVVDDHNHDEHGHVGDHNHGDQPGSPKGLLGLHVVRGREVAALLLPLGTSLWISVGHIGSEEVGG